MGGGVEDGSAPLGITAVDMAAAAAVPVFLMMAGALNLHPSALRRGPGAFWRQRAVRILPALVVWSAFYMLVIGPLAGAELSVGTAIDQVITGSVFRSTFGEDYGVSQADGPMVGLLARAVIVIDPRGTVTYTELVPEITTEPDYESALAAVRG